MVPRPISAVDAVNPAIQRTRQLLLGPFRWAVWWRLALIAMVISGQVYGNIVRIPDLLNAARNARHTTQDFAARANIWSDIFAGMSRGEMAMLIAIIAVLVLALIVVHIYIMSVVRFILFDFATTGRYRIREGWRNWQAPGQRLFAFNMFLFLVFGALAAIFVVAIVALVIRGGWTPATLNPIVIVLGVLFGLGGIFVLAIAGYVFSILAFDFGLPMMAVEGISGFTALGRAWRLFKSAKGDCAAYMGLKLAISIGLGIVISIVNLMIIFVVVLIGVIFVAAIGISTPNVFSNPVLLAAIITIAFVFFLVLSFVFALLVVPMLVFFQSYAVIFLAPRFLPLYYLMYGPPQEPPPAPRVEPEGPPPFPPELAPTS